MMEKFTTLTGIAAPLNIINIDTDMLVPKQYLKTILRTGLGRKRLSLHPSPLKFKWVQGTSSLAG